MTVRTGFDPGAAAGPIRSLIHEMDKDLAVYDVKTMRQGLSVLLAGVAALALYVPARRASRVDP